MTDRHTNGLTGWTYIKIGPNFKNYVVWCCGSSLWKFEDECSSPGSFHRGDPGMNGTERPSVWEGISHDTYYKFHYSLLSCTFTFFIPFTLPFLGTVSFSLDHNPPFSVLFLLIIIPLTSPIIIPKFTNDSSNNHISPNLPLHPSLHEKSHTLQLISPTFIQIYNFLYMTLGPGV